MADAQKELKIVINSDTDQAERGISSLGGSLRQMGTIAGGILAADLVKKVADVGFGIVTSSIKAYEETQNVAAQLDAVLKSTASVVNQGDKYITVTNRSAAETAKLKDELGSATARMHDLGAKMQDGKKHTETQALAFENAKNKVAELESKLGQAGTTTKKVTELTQLSKEKLIELSWAMQDATTYSDEEVLSAENLLLTFTSIGKDVFPQATQTVLDMSTALGQDLKSSSIQLGKALQDPILGVSALRRVGVNFSEDQQNVIKNLVKTGDVMGAQKLILKELTTEFGGSAKSQVNTFAGSMKQLQNQINDVQEILGKWFVDALTKAIVFIKPFVRALQDIIGDSTGVMDAIKNLGNYFPILGAVINPIVGIVTRLSAVIGPMVTTMTNIITTSRTWADITDQIAVKFPLLSVVIVSLSKAYDAFKNMVTDVLGYVAKLWDDNKKQIEPIIKDLATNLGQAFQELLPLVSIVFKGIAKLFVEAILLFGALTKNNWDNIHLIIVGAVTVIGGIIKEFFDAVSGIMTIFIDIFTGRWDKIWTDAKNTIRVISDDIKNIFKGMVDFISGIMGGLSQTINNVLSGIDKAGKGASNIGKRATGGFASGLTLVGENGPELLNLPNGSYVNRNEDTRRISGGISVTINNPSVRSDSDITAIVDQVRRVLGRDSELARLGFR